MKKDLKCFINNDVAQKLRYYVELTSAEISGRAKSKIIDGDIYIVDILLYKQECTGVTTSLDIDDQARVLYELQKKGENPLEWNVWWHSHAEMGVFWSGTDEVAISDEANNLGGYLVSIVTNKNGDFRTRVDVFPQDKTPFKITSCLLAKDEIPTFILPVLNDKERENELEEIYFKKYKEIEKSIEKINKISKQKIKSIEESTLKKTEAIENDFYLKNNLLIEELNKLTETKNEDETVKAEIEKEIKEKVSIPIPFESKYYRKRDHWFDKDDYYFDEEEEYLLPSHQNTFSKVYNERLTEIQSGVGLKKGMTLKQMKKLAKKETKKILKGSDKQEDREIGFTANEEKAIIY